MVIISWWRKSKRSASSVTAKEIFRASFCTSFGNSFGKLKVAITDKTSKSGVELSPTISTIFPSALRFSSGQAVNSTTTVAPLLASKVASKGI